MKNVHIKQLIVFMAFISISAISFASPTQKKPHSGNSYNNQQYSHSSPHVSLGNSHDYPHYYPTYYPPSHYNVYYYNPRAWPPQPQHYPSLYFSIGH